jgi:hypothetical protein
VNGKRLNLASEKDFSNNLQPQIDTKMLTESPEEIFLRFERPKCVWFDLVYVKSCRRYLAFRCNAFKQDPDWQLIDAATLPEAKSAILAWLKRN